MGIRKQTFINNSERLYYPGTKLSRISDVFLCLFTRSTQSKNLFYSCIRENFLYTCYQGRREDELTSLKSENVLKERHIKTLKDPLPLTIWLRKGTTTQGVDRSWESRRVPGVDCKYIGDEGLYRGKPDDDERGYYKVGSYPEIKMF